MNTRYHVEHLKNGEWLDVIDLHTHKTIYRYREDSAARLFKLITERHLGEFRLVQENLD